MNKKYIAPSVFCVELHTTKLMALSTNDSDPITRDNLDNYEQDVKGFKITNDNLWDNEW